MGDRVLSLFFKPWVASMILTDNVMIMNGNVKNVPTQLITVNHVEVTEFLKTAPVHTVIMKKVKKTVPNLAA